MTQETKDALLEEHEKIRRTFRQEAKVTSPDRDRHYRILDQILSLRTAEIYAIRVDSPPTS